MKSLINLFKLKELDNNLFQELLDRRICCEEQLYDHPSFSDETAKYFKEIIYLTENKGCFGLYAWTEPVTKRVNTYDILPKKGILGCRTDSVYPKKPIILKCVVILDGWFLDIENNKIVSLDEICEIIKNTISAVEEGIKSDKETGGRYFSIIGDLSIKNILSEIVSSKLQDDLRKTIINNATKVLAKSCQDSIELD